MQSHPTWVRSPEVHRDTPRQRSRGQHAKGWWLIFNQGFCLARLAFRCIDRFVVDFKLPYLRRRANDLNFGGCVTTKT